MSLRITQIKPLPAVCLAVLLVLLSCGDKKQKRQDAAQYKTMVVSKRDMTLERQYSARMTGKQIVEVRPQVSGCITQILTGEGQAVRKGQRNDVVGEVSVKTMRNAWLEAEAALAQAKAQEVNARNNLSYTEVKSPVSGVASMIPWHVGSLVSSSIDEPLVTVADDSEMYIYFSISENHALDLVSQYGSISEFINKAPEVGLRLNNGQKYDQKGHISAVSGTIDTQTGAVTLRATFPNASGLLHHGGSATVIVPTRLTDCIVIPQEATYELQNRSFVYRVVNGKTVATPVKLFPQHNGKNYIVEKGINVGDTIIAEGSGLLRDGVDVKSKER